MPPTRYSNTDNLRVSQVCLVVAIFPRPKSLYFRFGNFYTGRRHWAKLRHELSTVDENLNFTDCDLLYIDDDDH